ncbi:unnamed protein product, partial [Mesorhabditis belari]|uniref:C-type lectin domain-containing protein n=1 Tax=Mesorhabditis belari TaxID=2138241 RepID=A0AAF3EKT9_9BILA
MISHLDTIFLLSLLCVRSIAICPKSAVPGSTPGSCYFGVPLDETFQRGQTFCENFYAKLASIPSREDNEAVLNLGRLLGDGLKQIWLGGSYDGENITWLDGSTPSFDNLAPGTAAGDMVLNLDTGKWSTAAWNGLIPFVCLGKEEAPPNTIPTVPSQPITCPHCTCPPPPPPLTCPPPPTCPKQSPCPSEWIYSAPLKNCYKVVYSVHYDQTGDPCKSMGAQLASIHSDEENRVVNEVLRMGIGDLPYEWAGMIGGKRTGPGASDWAWMDGSRWDYSMWAAQQPDNSKGNEFCLQIYNDPIKKVDAGQVGKWNDIPCSTWFRAAACKRAADY